MKHLDLKKVMRWLGLILRCPICGLRYKLEQTKILESWQDEVLDEAGILIHSDCTKCKSSVMFNIEVNGPEVYSVGMITDLTQADSAKFKGQAPLKPNDVIAVHKAIRNFKGDFVTLFAPKKST